MTAKEYTPHTEPSFTYDALLPCPFCGGEAELLFIGNSYTKSRKAEIKCKKCYARIINAALKHGSEWVAKHSIDDWNKRESNLPSVGEIIDQLSSVTSDLNPYKEAGNAESYSQYNEGWCDACDILGGRIKEAILKLLEGGEG